MPKKKRRHHRPRPAASARSCTPSPARSHDHAHVPATPDRSPIHALLDEFLLCRLAELCPDHATLEAQHVEPLLDLVTADGEDPTRIRWTEERIRHLLLDLLPRHVWQPREMVLEQIPALGAFFTFLEAHGYWQPGSMEVRAAQELLDELVLPVLEIVEDPSHRSGPENIRDFARALGIRVDDPAERTVFAAWFNLHLTAEEQDEVAESGRLEGWPMADS